MAKETWRQIPDYPMYEVSDFGHVRSWHIWGEIVEEEKFPIFLSQIKEGLAIMLFFAMIMVSVPFLFIRLFCLFLLSHVQTSWHVDILTVILLTIALIILNGILIKTIVLICVFMGLFLLVNEILNRSSQLARLYK